VFLGIVGCPGPATTPPPHLTTTTSATPAAPGKLAVLAGRVRRDVSGDPVSGAILTVMPGEIQTTVDPDGHFRLPGLPVGRVEITVTAPGLANAVHTIVIQEGEQLVDLVVGGNGTALTSAISAVQGPADGRQPSVGEAATILGGGFGSTPGLVIVDGILIPVRRWQDGQIDVVLDSARLRGGVAEWVVRRADGQEMRRSLLIDGPTGPVDPMASAQPAPMVSDGPWHMRVLGADAPGQGRYESDFAAVTVGRYPAEWVDVLRDLDGKPSWLYPGRWYVDMAPGGRFEGTLTLRQVETAPQPYFTMRRYAGQAFGSSDGALPEQYSVTARIQAGNSPYYKSPVGEVALLLYYRDPGNYVQLVMERGHVALYEAIDARPLQSSGWKGYVWYPVITEVGDTHILGARVDAANGRVTPVIDGQAQGAVTIPSLRQGGRHYVAIRSIGNDMSVGYVRITTEVEPSPTPVPTPTATPVPTPTPTAKPTPTPVPTPSPTPSPTPTPLFTPWPTATPTPTPTPSPSASPSATAP
jgi:hypothetical protein